jgi:YidC/Oxa1 family membrane protein insertase
MQFFYRITTSYGLAIIMLTLIVRAVTFPLTIKGMRIQAKAMAEQQKIKPQIEELNKKYKDNPGLKNKKLMELYKQHGINPLAPLRGCLPMLFQMPIFFALYILLMQSIELKGQEFLWIADLAAPDKLFTFDFTLPIIGSNFNLLPILMGMSQFITSKISMAKTSGDPMQRQFAIMFPLFFMLILYNFPSGLVLYWLISNMLQVGLQLLVNKNVKEHMSETSATAKT